MSAREVDPHDARLEKYGSTLDRYNVRSVCEHIADYPEVVAAVHAHALDAALGEREGDRGEALVAVPLLGGLLGHAEDGRDLSPGESAEAEMGNLAGDVSIDVPPASDEGLEVSGRRHASSLVDADATRQAHTGTLSAGLKALDRHDAALYEFANVTDDGGEV